MCEHGHMHGGKGGYLLYPLHLEETKNVPQSLVNIRGQYVGGTPM